MIKNISRTVTNGRFASMRVLRRALTLVELLIVIAILSVLTAIALPVTKDLIEENRIKESVRTVQSFMEMARAKAMSTGREQAVEFISSDPSGTDPTLAGTVIEMKLGVGMPSYRGDIEGAACWLFHASGVDNAAVPNSVTPVLPANPRFANCAIVRKAECLSVTQTYTTLLNAQNDPSILLNVQLSINVGDYLVFDGIDLPIIGFSNCVGTEPPFVSLPGAATDYLKIYFDPRSLNPPPSLPSINFWKRTFEIRRTGIRAGQTTLTLPRGAAIDLYFSGMGLTGQNFSPLITGGLNNVSVVFSPSGAVSRIQGIPTVYPSMLYFLVGRADEVRADLASQQPTPLPVDDPKNLTNVVDPRATWLMVNPHNGRIATSPVRAPISGPGITSLDQLRNSRSLAIQPQEQE